MHSIAKLARSNPLLVIAGVGVGGWLLGSGIFAIPGLPSVGSFLTPHPTSPTAPAAPATLPVASSAAASLQTSSGAMSGPPAAVDPLAGWNV